MPQFLMVKHDSQSPWEEIEKLVRPFHAKKALYAVSKLCKEMLLDQNLDKVAPLSANYYFSEDSPVTVPTLAMLALLILIHSAGNEDPKKKKLEQVCSLLRAYVTPVHKDLGRNTQSVTSRSASSMATAIGATQLYLQRLFRQEPGLFSKTRYILQRLAQVTEGKLPSKANKIAGLLDYYFFFLFSFYEEACTAKKCIVLRANELRNSFEEQQLLNLPLVCRQSDVRREVMKCTGLKPDQIRGWLTLPASILFLNSHPIIDCEDILIAPVQHFLLSHAYDGIYYELAHGSEETMTAMGDVYEDYLGDVAKHKAFRRKKMPGPDLVIRYCDTCALIEVKSTRLPREIRFSGDLSTADTLLNQLAKAVEQCKEFQERLSRENKSLEKLYWIVAFWEPPWYWFSRHNWNVIAEAVRSLSGVDLGEFHQSRLLLCDLLDIETIVALFEHDAQKACSAIEECVAYLREIHYRGSFGLIDPYEEYQKACLHEYAMIHAGKSFEQASFVRVLYAQFIKHYLANKPSGFSTPRTTDLR